MEKVMIDALALEYTAKLNEFGYKVSEEYVRGLVDAAAHGTSKDTPLSGPAMFVYKWVKELKKETHG